MNDLASSASVSAAATAARAKGAAFDVRGLQGLRSSLASKSPEGVKESARQFEGMLTQMMLKAMRETVPKDGMFSSQAGDMYLSMFDQQLAQDVAGANGGTGLARSLENAMGRQMGIDMNPKATADSKTTTHRSSSDLPIAKPAAAAAAATSGETAASDDSTQFSADATLTSLLATEHSASANSAAQATQTSDETSKQTASDNEDDGHYSEASLQHLIIHSLSGLITQSKALASADAANPAQNVTQNTATQTVATEPATTENSAAVTADAAAAAIANATTATTATATATTATTTANISAGAAAEEEAVPAAAVNHSARRLENVRNLPLASDVRHVQVPSKVPTSGSYARSNTRAVVGDAAAANTVRNAVTNTDKDESEAEAFVGRIWEDAQAAARSTGIDAQYLVAHAALESGWGQSQPGGDKNPSYNLFGIKAGKGWSGRTVNALTTEYVNGRAVRQVEKFRAYNSYREGFEDYAKLMNENPRYENVLTARSGTEFARRLQNAGYATDPAYAAKLSGVFENSALKKVSAL